MTALDTLYKDIDRFQEPCCITYKYRFMELYIEFTEMEALKVLYMYNFVPRVNHLM